MTHHVLHVDREHRVPILVDLASAPRPADRLHPHQARRQGADPPAQQERRPHRRAPRQPRPGRAYPQHGGLPLRPGLHPGRHRHRRPRHPRRRRRPGGPRRPAGRAQGLPPPLRPYGAGRQRGHRGHADDQRAGPRRPRPDPGGRHQADHHPDPGLHAPGAAPSSRPAYGCCPSRSRQPFPPSAPRSRAPVGVGATVAAAPPRRARPPVGVRPRLRSPGSGPGSRPASGRARAPGSRRLAPRAALRRPVASGAGRPGGRRPPAATALRRSAPAGAEAPRLEAHPPDLL